MEIENRETGDLITWGWIGDDLAMERMADELSAGRLGRDAEKLRQMVVDARRALSMKR